MHTGDAGYFDDDGHLIVIDRAKDDDPARRHQIQPAVHREQTQVQPVHQGSRGLWRRLAVHHRDGQH
ncbi:MAG: hypothetical protein IPO34_20135 [Dehalococcoidia bacterium]|nr:hypothetical protein [Dehalococcoidia bacterium]